MSTRVAVIFGGRNSEHAISCVSASGIMEALEQSGYDVLPIGITQTGRWVHWQGEYDQLRIHDRTLPEVKDGVDVMLSADPSIGGFLCQGDVLHADVLFPVLHGAFGEDGAIQGLFELTEIPYVGCGVLSSAVGMDKEFTKRLLAEAGIPVAPYSVLRAGQQLDEAASARLQYPVFVKPARAGSSVGVSKVDSAEQLQAAITFARDSDQKVLMESAVVGHEVECGVLEGHSLADAPEASLPAEVRVVRGHEWYDFDAKYIDDACVFDIPAKFSPQVIQRVRETAARAFTALECSGLARVDCFVTDAGEVLINEINTLPGFTPTSMFPEMWAATGVAYPELVKRLVESAVR